MDLTIHFVLLSLLRIRPGYCPNSRIPYNQHFHCDGEHDRHAAWALDSQGPMDRHREKLVSYGCALYEIFAKLKVEIGRVIRLLVSLRMPCEMSARLMAHRSMIARSAGPGSRPGNIPSCFRVSIRNLSTVALKRFLPSLESRSRMRQRSLGVAE
jgi:hypothetical protein